jgi:hemolysin III
MRWVGQHGAAILCQLDHSAIHLLMAGAFTPFWILVFGDFWQWGSFFIIWSIAIIGLASRNSVTHAPR